MSDSSSSVPPGPDRAADADARLLLRVGRGDREAFTLLYDRLAARVMRFLTGLTQDPALAEDLTQDTFLAVWRAAPRWRPRGRVTTWIFQIAKRRWWKRSARRRMRLEREPLASARPEPTSGLEAAETAEEVARVRDAIRTLSPKLRIVFVLIRLENLAYAETAEIVGIRLGTVKSRMAAAESRLREVLTDD